MPVEINQVTPTELRAYASIPMTFYADSAVDITQSESGGYIFVNRKLNTPYIKDYDSIMSPLAWEKHFDLSVWGFFIASQNSKVIGGTVIVLKDNKVQMLEKREDLAVLWDIRVHPELRGIGIGSQLFHAAEEWSRKSGMIELKIETQNNNLPAIRFYQKHGCTLRHVVPFAYPEFPEEVQLLWYKNLWH